MDTPINIYRQKYHTIKEDVFLSNLADNTTTRKNRLDEVCVLVSDPSWLDNKMKAIETFLI